MVDKRPMLYLSWDKTGMFLWLGSRPKRSWEDDVYRSPSAIRMRLPISWYGGLVDMNECVEYDPEIILNPTSGNGDAGLSCR